MEPIDPETGAPAASRRVSNYQTAGLILIVTVLVLSSVFTLRAPRAKAGLDVAQMQVDTLLRTRALYSARTASRRASSAPTDARARAVIADLARIANAAPTPRAFRRLALTQFTFGDPEWRSSLLRLQSLPGTGSTFETEHELAMWQQVLDGNVGADTAATLARQISKLELGWYEHLALESLYRRAGMAGQADTEVAKANYSTSKLLIVVYLAVLAGMAGALFGMRQIIVALGMRKRGSQPGEILTPPKQRPFRLEPIGGEAANVLYTAFIIYLATFAAIRLIMGQLLGRTIAGQMSSLPSESALLIQIGVSIVSLLPTAAWLIIKGRRAGLTPNSIGLNLNNLPMNIWWGISGYAVALPLVYAASVISSWLFKGVQSPAHPVIADLVGTRGPLYLALMFLQVAVIPPIAEEIMFRGVFFRALSAKMAVPAALILTSALFAVLLTQLPLGFLGIFVLGIIFNMLYLTRGSLLPSMIAHGLNNGVIFLFFVLLTSE
jgi:membrane protease YdiL (CAAX protease family)